MKTRQRKKQRVDESEGEDYISNLPNSILCKILSCLNVREGVKTSVLSSKWHHSYASPGNLILDAENILKDHYDAVEFLRNRTPYFVDSVNKYLSNVKRVRKVDKLKVFFTFQNDTGHTDLDEWIRFAVERNVQEIELFLMEVNQFSASKDSSLYVFPCDIVGNEGASSASASTSASTSGFRPSLKCMRLAHCVLAPQKCYNFGFSTIITMELIKVDLKSEMHFQILLSSCKDLEWLGVSECYNVNCLKVEHKKLKYLNVNVCRELKALVIHSKSLQTLEYKGNKIEFSFDAPMLKTVYSRVGDSIASQREVWPVFRLSDDLPQVENLMLECSCYMGEVMVRRRLPTFLGLRRLQVIKVSIKRQDLMWVAKVLNAFPELGRLELHLRTYSCVYEEIREEFWPPECPHNHLKKVTITGISGHSSEIEIAIYLLKNAIALEKMTIDPRPKSYLGNGKWDHSQACDSWSREMRQKVHEYLEPEVNPRVTLLIK